MSPSRWPRALGDAQDRPRRLLAPRPSPPGRRVAAQTWPQEPGMPPPSILPESGRTVRGREEARGPPTLPPENASVPAHCPKGPHRPQAPVWGPHRPQFPGRRDPDAPAFCPRGPRCLITRSHPSFHPDGVLPEVPPGRVVTLPPSPGLFCLRCGPRPLQAFLDLTNPAGA